MRLLLVEDHEFLAETVAGGLRREGIAVDVAYDGRDALARSRVVPADQVQRLFQPFQRLNGTRTQHTNGHGLGLSIVNAIATAHDAAITSQAQPEGGLAIQISFPLSDKPRERPGRQMPAPA